MLYFGNKTENPTEPLFKWKQVHGTRCIEVTSNEQDCGDADALWTRVSGLTVGVITADCVPILLNHKKAVAAIHAGWRGTEAQIIEQFFKSLPAEFSNPSEWRAMMGPSIRACCYEVSEELIKQFVNKFSEIPKKLIEPNRRKLDLVQVNRFELNRLGVQTVEVHPDCTFCSRSEQKTSKYFSYRRGDRCSRQLSTVSFSVIL